MQYTTKSNSRPSGTITHTPLEKEHSRVALAQRLASSYYLGGDDNRAKRVRLCGMEVRSLTCSNDPAHYHKVAVPHRCRVRLCPSCSTAAANVAGQQMREVLNQLNDADNESAWIMLTLTAPNVPAEGLQEAVGGMLKAWTKMHQYAEVKAGTKGWARRMEITYNVQRNDYHPHIHALIHVKPTYFKKQYVTHDRWASMWGTALGVDYKPIVDVRRVKSAKGAVEATGKYALKPISLEAIADNPEAVCTVTKSIHRRRLLDYGGDVAKARKALKQLDPEKVEDERPDYCPTCGSPITEAIMHWTEDAYTRFATLDKHI